MSDSRSATRDDGNLTFNIYGYDLSLGAAIFFIVIFSVITIIQAVYVVRSRAWWLIVLLVGGIGQIIGWAGRAWSARDVYSLDAFLIQQICLILSPCFYSATVYGCLGVLIRAIGRPELSKLRPRWYLIVFCLLDLLAIVIQAVGGAMAAIALQNDDSSSTGTHIMLSGIVLQLISMIVFCLLAFDFWHNAKQTLPGKGGKALRLFVFGLKWASGWILVRCAFRTAELSYGWSGHTIHQQPFFICLDTLPMLFTQAIFLVTFPPFLLDPAQPGPVEEGYKQSRGEPREPWISTTERGVVPEITAMEKVRHHPKKTEIAESAV